MATREPATNQMETRWRGQAASTTSNTMANPNQINTVNSIEAFAEDEVSLMSDEESGMISYHLQENPSKEAGLLLNSMILGLQNMVDDENYAEYIDLTFEEV